MAATQIITHKNYIGGQWVESVTGRTYQVHNPARTDQVVGEFQTSGADDALSAVAAAKDGLTVWANTPAPARASIIYKALEIMGRRAAEMAETITIEEGKPIGDAQGEVKRAMNIMEYAAGEGRRMFGYTTPSELPNTVAYTVRRPLGVVGIITPWNFPLAIPAWKIAPALICGNALVFKPASATPLSAVKLIEIFEEAGLPAGVLNLVTGPGGQVGNALVESPDVKGISFTGSTEVGTELYAESAKRLKKVQAEMGGKNAVIVLADADMDKAMGGIVQGAFGSTGQRCTATSRVIVEDEVYDRFMAELIDRTGKLTIGDGIDPSIDVSPLASQNQKDKVMEYIGIGTEEGANLAFGGRVDTPIAPVNTPETVADDPQFHHRMPFHTIDDLGAEQLPLPVHIDGDLPPAPTMAPRVGEHTDEVLPELGLDADRIAALRAAGVVGAADPEGSS